MRVFIQNKAGKAIKHRHNEKTLEFLSMEPVSRACPFPYGFILGTTAEDGLNVDCFVLTDTQLETGEIVECIPVGLMEQIENGIEDHNVLAVLEGDERPIDAQTKQILTEFVSHVFAHMPDNHIRVGRFLGQSDALSFISARTDSKS